MKRTRPYWFVPLVMMFVVGACSGGDDDGGAASGATAGAGSVTPTGTGTGSAGTAVTTTPVTAPVTSSVASSTASTPTTVPVEPPLFEGLEGIVILQTPEAGGGNRPVLGWDPFDGADRYTVAVYAPDGRVYWSWSTTNTSIPVGGEPQLRADAPGPSVTEGMSWAVVAYDVDDLPIAVSGQRPIAP